MTAALAHLAVLADPTRSRLLLALEENELTVGELCAALQLPQSSVSRHLKALGDDGWVVSRADGTSRFYRRAASSADIRDRLWAVVREEVAPGELAEQDRARVEAVITDRRRRSKEYFSAIAGEWERVRETLFGNRADIELACAMLPPDAVVGDLGCGTGHLAALIAPHVARLIAVDGSLEMLRAAKDRMAQHQHVEIRRGELEQLPIEDGVLDIGILSLVLHYVADPVRVFAEARRTLRADGRIIIMDMTPHTIPELTATMGHVWPGFSEPQLRGWLDEAGFSRIRYRVFAPEPEARGPMLFTAQAMR
jgi:ArsR family transcriptional regulator